MKHVKKFKMETLKERNRSENIGAGGRIILKWNFGSHICGCRLHSSGSGQGPVVG
jgi:hypothetical protein